MSSTPIIFQDVLSVELNTPISISVDITPKNDINLQKHLSSAENVFAASNTLTELLSHTSEHTLGYADKEIILLDKKLDICIRLLTLLFEERKSPDTQLIKISARGIQWHSEQAIPDGQQMYIEFYPSLEFPQPVRLPIEVISSESEDSLFKIQARFLDLSSGVQDGLEKLIFREHRREISRQKTR